MRRILIAAMLFGASFGVSYAGRASSAEAAKPTNCPYCHGDSCGRGTVGGSVCFLNPTGCIEGGDCGNP